MNLFHTTHRVPTGALIAVILSLIMHFQVGCASYFSSKPTTLDLTYAFDHDTVYWPNNTAFHWEKTSWGLNSHGDWYASGVFSASEHGGTHMDAPIHFSRSGWTVDEIPPHLLTAEAVVLDIRPQVRSNKDYTLQVEDILKWEEHHDTIPPQAIVLLLTGWGQYWPDPMRYFGTSTPHDPSSLHFPGFSAESMTFLLTHRAIVGVGIDTASIDPGQSKTFSANRVLAEANRYALENVAHMDRLPPRGTHITALPMKIKGGSGSPVRILATIPASMNP